MLTANKERDEARATADEALEQARQAGEEMQIAIWNKEDAEERTKELAKQVMEHSSDVGNIKEKLEETLELIAQMRQEGRKNTGVFATIGNFVDDVFRTVLPFI